MRHFKYNKYLWKGVLVLRIFALRKIMGKYLCFWGGDFVASRNFGRSVMSERDEMRRLIDVIEKGAGNASVEQNVEDLKLFANTASFLANKIDAKTKGGDAVKAKQAAAPKLRVPKPKLPKTPQQQSQTPNGAMPQATSVATSSADFEKLKRVEPQPARNNAVTGIGSF